MPRPRLEVLDFQIGLGQLADVLGLKDALELSHHEGDVFLTTPADDDTGNEGILVLHFLHFDG